MNSPSKSRLDQNANSSDLASSNLSHFLEHTMPSVSTQFLPKSCLWNMSAGKGRSGESEALPFYSLGDLWQSFDEWSAYGAGVPLLLNGEETVVQYYVPYLSALQLYVRSAARPQLRFRKPGEESDISDSDGRESGSDWSSDGESEFVRRPQSFQQRCSRAGHWQSECNLRTSARVSSSSSEGMVRRCSSCSTMDDQEEDEENVSRGELLFEYFEESVPYSRVPLVDKISSLTHESLELATLRSVDLLPTSWMSIAWYPIYRIPTGPTLQDLAASFLTFHTLATPLEAAGGAKQYVKGACENGVRGDKYVLPSFGLASYKLRGTLWTSVESSERLMATYLQGTAESFLKKLRVRHPDFDFFVSNGGRC